MLSCAAVTIHPSQFPERVREDLLTSVRTRRINHKFHYDSYKQTSRWLRLHEACSPARTDPDCGRIYEESFTAVAGSAGDRSHVIGLGCGGGRKDARLLERLARGGDEPSYSPVDVSLPMVLVARAAAMESVPGVRCFPLVCDLATAHDLAEVLRVQTAPGQRRLLTFFGMIPNFEPGHILPLLASLMGSADELLFSANLAPGPDYDAGVRQVLPLYDNELTRDWLMAFLLDLGVENRDGEMRFTIADDREAGLKRIEANFQFERNRQVRVESTDVEFRAGETIRMFFSYRHTPELVRTLLGGHGLEVRQQWITASEEEGVFLVSRRS